MRTQPTASEAKLWAALSGGKLGVPFRRQMVIGQRISDFVAPSCRLVVEVDGAYHAGTERADRRRERELQAHGYRVLRVQADSVMADIGGVLASIREAIG